MSWLPKRSQSLAHRPSRLCTNEPIEASLLSVPPRLVVSSLEESLLFSEVWTDKDTDIYMSSTSSTQRSPKLKKMSNQRKLVKSFSSSSAARDGAPIKNSSTIYLSPTPVTHTNLPMRSSLKRETHSLQSTPFETTTTAGDPFPRLKASPYSNPLSDYSPLKPSRSISTIHTKERKDESDEKQRVHYYCEEPTELVVPSQPSQLSHQKYQKYQKYQNTELQEVLIQWKRTSSLQQEQPSVPPIETGPCKNHPSSQEILTVPSSPLPLLPDMMDQQRESQAREVANKLWREEEGTVSKEEMTSYFGKLDPFHQRVLVHYLKHFDFKRLTLEEAFRKLCSKLHFKAEAQEIDRVLEAFSIQYWACHNDSLYRDKDVVYAVVYSLMLLNTDLHVAQRSGHVRMTCAEFIKNTMQALLDHAYYAKTCKENPGLFHQWQQDMEICLKLINSSSSLQKLYVSVKQNGILQPFAAAQQQLERKPTLLKRIGSRKHLLKRGHSTREDKHHSAIAESCYANKLKNNHGPWSKGCYWVKKSSLGRGHKEWKLSRVILDNGYLLIDITHDGMRKMSSLPLHDSLEVTKEPTDKSHDTEIPLSHCLASAVSVDHRSFVMSVQTPFQEVYFIEYDTKEQQSTWILYCNYWSARESKIPLRNGVSSTEYGWSTRILERSTDLSEATISDWKAPTPPSGESHLDQEAQSKALVHYAASLSQLHSLHYSYLPLMKMLSSRSPNYNLIMANWKAKKEYLEQEMMKYTCYCESISSWQATPLLLLSEDRPFSLGVDLWEEVCQEYQRRKGSDSDQKGLSLKWDPNVL
ncbi:hypothetical protein BDF14DRAFT_1877514 [Spinellus fusiger]|nr:hypothetical protein BDF14DRAFT_1877514 [Spinellus fusiger]